MYAPLITGFLPQGGAPLRQFVSSETFAPSPEIWSENNRKISITKENCITIDFKTFLEESQDGLITTRALSDCKTICTR